MVGASVSWFSFRPCSRRRLRIAAVLLGGAPGAICFGDIAIDSHRGRGRRATDEGSRRRRGATEWLGNRARSPVPISSLGGQGRPRRVPYFPHRAAQDENVEQFDVLGFCRSCAARRPGRGRSALCRDAGRGDRRFGLGLFRHEGGIEMMRCCRSIADRVGSAGTREDQCRPFGGKRRRRGPRNCDRDRRKPDSGRSWGLLRRRVDDGDQGSVALQAAGDGLVRRSPVEGQTMDVSSPPRAVVGTLYPPPFDEPCRTASGSGSASRRAYAVWRQTCCAVRVRGRANATGTP